MVKLDNDDFSNQVDGETVQTGMTNIEKHMYEVIKKSNHVEHVMMGDALDDITKGKILDLLIKPKGFIITDRGLVFINEDGDEEECVNYGTNITADGKWLSEKIDSVSFDIEQDGNLRKAQEAQSAYCLCTIYCVMNDSKIKEEIELIASNYNYSTMSPHDGFSSFTQLLAVYQDLQSTAINICISASKYNISNIKKDSEKFLKESIPENRISGLKELDLSIAQINRKYSLGRLSPENVRYLTKLEVLSELDKRNREIEIKLVGGIDLKGNKIEPHKESTLWRILNISTEYIPPMVKRRLAILAETEVEKLFKEHPNLQMDISQQKQLSDKWKKRYFKIARLSIRKTQVDKYLSDENSYILPVKL